MLYGKRFLFIVCALLLLAACSSKVSYLDNKDVEVEATHVEEEGHLLVHLTFENDSSSAVNHSVYRVEWLDADDRVIETTSWRPLIIKGKAKVRATERSTKPGVVDFVVQISNDAS